jgi:surface antigen
MAYVDEALPADEMRRIKAILDAHPDEQARMLPFILTRERLPDLISAAVSSPLPERLVQTVMTAPIATPRSKQTAASQPSLLHRLSAALLPDMPAFAGALALATCVALIGGAGFMAAKLTPAPEPQVAQLADAEAIAAGPLSEALERMASGSALERGLVHVTPLATVRDTEGRFCREYQMQRAGTAKVSGFACRTGDGRWSIAFHAPNASPADQAASASNSNADYEPASGEGGSALDRYIAEASRGDVITGADEAELISKGWPRD